MSPTRPSSTLSRAWRTLGYTLFVSGNYRRAGIEPARFPWVRFLGYVSEQQYYAYLPSCAVSGGFDDVEDCLLCGAYEAVAARNHWSSPIPALLRDYFGAPRYSPRTVPSKIAQSVQHAYAQPQ